MPGDWASDLLAGFAWRRSGGHRENGADSVGEGDAGQADHRRFFPRSSVIIISLVKWRGYVGYAVHGNARGYASYAVTPVFGSCETWTPRAHIGA